MKVIFFLSLLTCTFIKSHKCPLSSLFLSFFSLPIVSHWREKTTPQKEDALWRKQTWDAVTSEQDANRANREKFETP